ncbi:hypothetical protein G7054_g3112 [Neopestalotiopsis clavispora]|nr:hypothetical protein G7054_g3112 [Neopestalotiopsis clavispora]
MSSSLSAVDALAPLFGFILFASAPVVSPLRVRHPNVSRLFRDDVSAVRGAALGRRSAGRPDWRVLASAAALTLVMIPFTLLYMQPTIDAMFVLRKLDIVGEKTTLEEVQALAVKWQWQHVVRSMFPLAGSALGFLGASGKVVF